MFGCVTLRCFDCAELGTTGFQFYVREGVLKQLEAQANVLRELPVRFNSFVFPAAVDL